MSSSTRIPLDEPASTRVVEVVGGSTIVTSPQAQHGLTHLSGYFLVECASIDRAVEIAARFPDAQFGRVEVRPVTMERGD